MVAVFYCLGILLLVLMLLFHITNNLALFFSERFTIEECFQHPWIKVMFSESVSA